MQLQNARLCLDCDEIHDAAQCPLCASETFTFIKRWVPTPERRAVPRASESSKDETLSTYRELLGVEPRPRPSFARTMARGALGLTALGIVGWMWRHGSSSAGKESPGDAGARPARPVEVPRSESR